MARKKAASGASAREPQAPIEPKVSWGDEIPSLVNTWALRPLDGGAVLQLGYVSPFDVEEAIDLGFGSVYPENRMSAYLTASALNDLAKALGTYALNHGLISPPMASDGPSSGDVAEVIG